MYRILTSNPPQPADGAVHVSYRERDGWPDSMGAVIMPVMVGDERCGPLIVLSYVAPSEEQMPLSFAHAHASDNWRISIQGTTDVGRDSYTNGQFRFHDGGVPYASDNFAWGPDGGYGMIMFADRRGFAIRPVKAEIAERIAPQERMIGEALGIDMQDPCPGAPAIATTMGPTSRAHLDGGFDQAHDWSEVVPGVRMAVGLAGEPTCGPVLVFLDAAGGVDVLGERRLGTEVLVAPVAGSIDVGATRLRTGDVRLEEADTDQPPVVAGVDGAQMVAIVADRRALRSALDAGTFTGPVATALSSTLHDLQGQLVPA